MISAKEFSDQYAALEAARKDFNRAKEAELPSYLSSKASIAGQQTARSSASLSIGELLQEIAHLKEQIELIDLANERTELRKILSNKRLIIKALGHANAS